jgi:hypothetical protein
MYDVRAAGDWSPQQVAVTWSPASSRRIVPEVERAIDDAWRDAASRLGDKLFDGPLCRLERWAASPQRLELTLSRTSYRAFLGTNLFNAQFGATFGDEVLANPVGVSAALRTADGFLLLGRRNESVAYHPNRVHPFAGSLVPRDRMEVFDEIRRELREELHLEAADVPDIRCVGLAEDRALRQPELMFVATTTRTRGELAAQLDRAEHHDIYAVVADPADVRRAMADPRLTPIAVASLTLWLERT